MDKEIDCSGLISCCTYNVAWQIVYTKSNIYSYQAFSLCLVSLEHYMWVLATLNLPEEHVHVHVTCENKQPKLTISFVFQCLL